IKMIVVLEELGGRDEYSLGAKSGGEMESAQAKNQALHDAGAIVEGAMLLLQRKFKPPQILEDLNLAIKNGKVRAPTHIISTISMTEAKSHAMLVSQCLPLLNRVMVWVMSFSCCGSNATFPVTAQGSLSLLTIGPRFGGAIDDDARYFKDAYDKVLVALTTFEGHSKATMLLIFNNAKTRNPILIFLQICRYNLEEVFINFVFISIHQFFSPLSKVKDEQQNGVVELKDVQDNHR
ncbi:ATP-citrate synthase beta chain protein 2, partial [Camellia lanceoleosa]